MNFAAHKQKIIKPIRKLAKVISLVLNLTIIWIPTSIVVKTIFSMDEKYCSHSSCVCCRKASTRSGGTERTSSGTCTKLREYFIEADVLKYIILSISTNLWLKT